MVYLTDKDKQILLDRYCDIEWCDAITSDLRCVLCNRIAINHYWSAKCPHLHCMECDEIYVDVEDPEFECPICQSIGPLKSTDFDVEDKIHELRICCPNKKYGCNYVDQLRKMPWHLMTCVDTREKALKAESPITSTTEDVVTQLRYLNATVGELSNRMKVVDEVAEKLIHVERNIDDIKCKINTVTSDDNKVEERKPGMKLVSTEYTKEFQSITLKLKSMNQRILENETFVQKKMEQLTLKIEEIGTKVNSIAEQKDDRQKKRPKQIPMKAETYEWTVKNVYESEVFNITACKYDIKAKFERPMISLQFKNGDKINEFLNTDDQLTSVTYIIRDQSNTRKKRDIYHRENLRFGTDCRQLHWIHGYCLPDETQSPPYTKNNSIRITILFDPQLIESFIPKDGRLLWRVNNYKGRKQNPLYYDNWSPCFYTSPQGYGVRAELSIRERSLSVEVVFLAGKHDTMLPFDYHHKTTVKLLNQSNLSKNWMISRHRRDVHAYTITFDEIEPTEENGFLNLDSLLLSVVVEPLATK